jgi:hypothetical protein
MKDPKKWDNSFALWQELEKKKGKCNGNGNASTNGVINLDVQEPCLGNPAGEDLASAGRARQPPGHKATKADIAPAGLFLGVPRNCQGAHGQEGRGHKYATTKSFVDLQERYIAAHEAIAKARP